MKKNINQIILAVLLIASCQAINSGWRDWFTPAGMNNNWNNLKSWVATQWTTLWAAIAGAKPGELSTSRPEDTASSYYPIPHAPSTVPLTSMTSEEDIVTPYSPPVPQPVMPTSPSTSIISPAPIEENVTILRTRSQENLLNQELAQEISTFLDRLSQFASDLSLAHRQSLTFDTLKKNNKGIMDDLDTLSQSGIPKSIRGQLAVINNPELSARLAAALAPLKSDLPWKDLADKETLENTVLTAQVAKDFAHYLRKKDDKRLKDYAHILENDATQQRLIVIPTSQEISSDDIFKLMRSFKIQQTFSAFYNNKNHSSPLSQGIITIYKEFFPQASKPDFTFLYYFA